MVELQIRACGEGALTFHFLCWCVEGDGNGLLAVDHLDIEDDLVDWFQEESSRGVDHAGVHLGVGGERRSVIQRDGQHWCSSRGGGKGGVSYRGVDNTGVHLGVGGKEECHTEGWTTLVFI